MPAVQTTYELPVPPAVAARLWTDVNRWPTFVDGFGHIVDIDGDWPAPRAKVVWESGPAGRGRVTERIVECDETHVVTEVFEAQLHGRQALFFEPGRVTMRLDYELQNGGGPLRKLTDILFIRRALAMAQERTLRRFSTEAADEALL